MPSRKAVTPSGNSSPVSWRSRSAHSNNVPRTDFFGGKHTYHRDADGLYSPPPYLYDTMSSSYLNYLGDGPPPVVEDLQSGERKRDSRDRDR